MNLPPTLERAPLAAPPRHRRRRMRESTRRALLGTASVAALLVVWQGLGATGLLSPRDVSSPLRMLAAGAGLWGDGDLERHLVISGEEFGLGMLAATALSIPLGLLLGWYRRLRYLVEPLLMTAYSMPRDAFLPLIIVMLGLGITSRAALAFLGAVFPIVVNTMAGIRTIDRMLVRVARSFGAGDREVFTKILLPATLPYIMAGIRLGIGRALIGVIVAEMYVSVAGLGSLIMAAQAGLNTDALVFVTLTTSAIGFVVLTLSRRIEARVVPWKPSDL
jgi:NitT/TauT family transport system permease protein